MILIFLKIRQNVTCIHKVWFICSLKQELIYKIFLKLQNRVSNESNISDFNDYANRYKGVTVKLTHCEDLWQNDNEACICKTFFSLTHAKPFLLSPSRRTIFNPKLLWNLSFHNFKCINVS